MALLTQKLKTKAMAMLNQGMKPPAIARELKNVSEKTVYRWKRELEGETNGICTDSADNA